MKMPKKIVSLLAAIMVAALTIPAEADRKRKPQIGIGIGPGGIGIRIGPAQIRKKRRIRRERRGNLIAPSRAAKRAQGAYGGKILGVRLRGGVYIVKLRGAGRIRKVKVDAKSGQILGP